ncbi:hypothetical protein Tco_0866332, partial [Tanacetum coccineum]
VRRDECCDDENAMKVSVGFVVDVRKLDID